MHVAAIDNNPFSGVCISVTALIAVQQETESVALVNLENILIDGIINQFQYRNPLSNSKAQLFSFLPDIVVFHEIYHPEYLGIARGLVKRKIPYIIVPHGSLTQMAQNKKALKKRISNVLAFNAFVKNAAEIQFLSDNEKKCSAVKTRSFVAGNGTALPDKTKINVNRQEIKMVYIGRLEVKIKGLDIMLEGVRLAADAMRENNCRLYVYGPDILGRRAAVEAIILKNGIEDLVCLNSEIWGEKKESVLIDADVFIQTSRSEGMPTGILEALSYGLPCIVTEGTNLGELIKEHGAGWSAETKAAAIGETIRIAIGERNNWCDMSSNARKLAETDFNWKSVAHNIVCEYRKALNFSE